MALSTNAVIQSVTNGALTRVNEKLRSNWINHHRGAIEKAAKEQAKEV